MYIPHAYGNLDKWYRRKIGTNKIKWKETEKRKCVSEGKNKFEKVQRGIIAFFKSGLKKVGKAIFLKYLNLLENFKMLFKKKLESMLKILMVFCDESLYNIKY